LSEGAEVAQSNRSMVINFDGELSDSRSTHKATFGRIPMIDDVVRLGETDQVVPNISVTILVA
jgi:hypothetical protein